MKLSLGEWADLATILGAVAAIIVLGYTAYQVRMATAVSRGQFSLELEKMLASHDAVHLLLRPGGAWASGRGGPGSSEEWARLEDYMGFFEHCEVLLEKRLIDRETFDAIFAYRLDNILANPIIVNEKLRREAGGWRIFLRLVQRAGKRLPE